MENDGITTDIARAQQLHSSHHEEHLPSDVSPGHGSEQSLPGDADSTISAIPGRAARKPAKRSGTMRLSRRDFTNRL